MSGRFGEYTNEIESMMQIIRPAVELSLIGQDKLKKNDVLIKSDHSPVSICDFACQTLIVKGIKEYFPKDNVLGEEDVTHQDSSYIQLVRSLLPDDVDPVSTCKGVISNITEDMHRVWVIDPIDGTYAFIQNGNYAIATALLVDFEVVCSVVAWPRHKSELTGIPLEGPLLFISAKNHGSYAADLKGNYFQIKKKENPRNRLLYSLNTPKKLQDTFEYIKEKVGITEESQDSSMTKAFTIAAGAGNTYLRLKYSGDEHVWDIAPFDLFLREAGCYASTIDGKPLRYSNKGKVINSASGLIFTSKEETFQQKTVDAFREAYDKFYK